MNQHSRVYRPDRTRQRLIDAGLRLFGVAGREAVSTRQLAEAANVNLNAIHYHFGSKDDVYLAVAVHLTETTGADIRAAADNALEHLEAIHPADAAERLADVLVAVVRTILSAPDSAYRGGFILREQLQPTAAFDVLHDGFVARLHEAIAALIGRALDLAPDHPATIVRAHAMLGQALVFGMARETLARRLRRKKLTVTDFQTIFNGVAELARDALAGAVLRQSQAPLTLNNGDDQ